MVDGGAFLTSVGAGVSVRGTHSVRLVGAETVATVGDTHGCLDVHGDWHESWAPSGLHSGSAGDGRRRASLRVVVDGALSLDGPVEPAEGRGGKAAGVMA